jgi:hypothetical protein
MMPENAETKTAASEAASFEFLEPERVRLSADESGGVRLTLSADRSYVCVKAVSAFPLSRQDGYIALLDAAAGDKPIGLIVDPDRLDAHSRRVLADSLAGHYFLPVVQKIHAMKEEFGAVYCDVETDRGRRQFIVKGIRDTIQELGDGELIIPDVDGNRYRIPDWRRLDARSRRLLGQMV